MSEEIAFLSPPKKNCLISHLENRCSAGDVYSKQSVKMNIVPPYYLHGLREIT